MLSSARTPAFLLTALLGLLGPPAVAADDAAPAPVVLAIRAPSTLSYHLDHTLHEVIGISRRVEGTATLTSPGAVAVEVRARVDGFDSGNGSRDARMLEVTEAARFPLVVLEAKGTFAPPAAWPATVEVTLTGTLAFHGLVRPVTVPARVAFTAPDAATATATFAISLKEFQVEPPSLLFMRIKDRAVITATLALSAVPRAP
jgi:polyisoprenoid-binding protein YceI